MTSPALHFEPQIQNLVSILPTSATTQDYILGNATLTSNIPGLDMNSTTFELNMSLVDNLFTTPPINVVLKSTDATGILMKGDDVTKFRADIDDVTSKQFGIFIKTATSGSPRIFPHLNGSDPIFWTSKVHFRKNTAVETLGQKQAPYSFNPSDTLAYYTESAGMFYWISSFDSTSITYMNPDYSNAPAFDSQMNVFEAVIVPTDMQLPTAVQNVTYTVIAPAISTSIVTVPQLNIVNNSQYYSYPAMENSSGFYIAEISITDGVGPYRVALICEDENPATEEFDDPIKLEPVSNTTNKWRIKWETDALPSYSNVSVKIVVNDSGGHFKETSFRLNRFNTNPTFSLSFQSGGDYPVRPFTNPNLYIISNTTLSSGFLVGTMTRSGGDESQSLDLTFTFSTTPQPLKFNSSPTQTTIATLVRNTSNTPNADIAGTTYNVSVFTHSEHDIVWNIFSLLNIGTNNQTSLSVVGYNRINSSNLQTTWYDNNRGVSYFLDTDPTPARQEITLNSISHTRLKLYTVNSVSVGSLSSEIFQDFSPNPLLPNTLLSNLTFTAQIPGQSAANSSVLFSFNSNFVPPSGTNYLAPPAASIKVTDAVTLDTTTVSVPNVFFASQMQRKVTPTRSFEPLGTQFAVADDIPWYFIDTSVHGTGSIFDSGSSVQDRAILAVADLIEDNTGSFVDEGLRCEIINQTSSHGANKRPIVVYEDVITGPVSGTTIVLPQTASTQDDFYKDHTLYINSQTYLINGYVASTRTLTLTTSASVSATGPVSFQIRFVPSTTPSYGGGYGLRISKEYSSRTQQGPANKADVKLYFHSTGNFEMNETDASFLSGVFTLRIYDNFSTEPGFYMDVQIGVIFWKSQSVLFDGYQMWPGVATHTSASARIQVDGFIGYQRRSGYPVGSLSIDVASKSSTPFQSNFFTDPVQLPSARAGVKISLTDIANEDVALNRARLMQLDHYDPAVQNIKIAYTYTQGDFDITYDLKAANEDQIFYFTSSTFTLKTGTTQSYRETFITAESPLFFDNGLSTVNILGDFTTQQYNDLYPENPAKIFSLGPGSTCLVAPITSFTSTVVTVAVPASVPLKTYKNCKINGTWTILSHTCSSSPVPDGMYSLEITVDSTFTASLPAVATVTTTSFFQQSTTTGLSTKLVVKKLPDNTNLTSFLNNIRTTDATAFNTLQSSSDSDILFKVDSNSSYAQTAITNIPPSGTLFEFFVPQLTTIPKNMPITPVYVITYSLKFDSDNSVINKYHVLQWTQDLNFNSLTLSQDLSLSFFDSTALTFVPGITSSGSSSESDADLRRQMVLKWKLERRLTNSSPWETAVDCSGFKMNFLDDDYANHPGHHVSTILAMLQTLQERVDSNQVFPIQAGVTTGFFQYRLTARRYQLYRNPQTVPNRDLQEPTPSPSTTYAFGIQYANDMAIVVSNPVQLSSPSVNLERWTGTNEWKYSAATRFQVYAYDLNTAANKMVRCSNTINPNDSNAIVGSSRNVYRLDFNVRIFDPSALTSRISAVNDSGAAIGYVDCLGSSNSAFQVANTQRAFNVYIPNPRYLFAASQSNISVDQLATNQTTFITRNFTSTIGTLENIQINPMETYDPLFFRSNAPNVEVASISLTGNGTLALAGNRNRQKEIRTAMVYRLNAGVATLEFDSNTYTVGFGKNQTVEIYHSGTLVAVRSVTSHTLTGASTHIFTLDTPISALTPNASYMVGSLCLGWLVSVI